MPPLRLPDEPDRPPLRLPRLRRPPTDRLNRGLSRSGDPEEACERRQALCRVVRHEPSSAICEGMVGAVTKEVARDLRSSRGITDRAGARPLGVTEVRPHIIYRRHPALPLKPSTAHTLPPSSTLRLRPISGGTLSPHGASYTVRSVGTALHRRERRVYR